MESGGGAADAMRAEKRGNWYLLTGLILGVALGLGYAWVLNPVEYVDAPPYALRQDFKDQYRTLIAVAYLYSGDLDRAIYRLQALQDEDITRTLAMQAQQALAEGRPEMETQALGRLAVALGQGPAPVVASPAALVTLPSPTLILATSTAVLASSTPVESLQPTLTPVSILRTPQPTNTPLPTLSPTPSPTLGAPFLLQDVLQVCNPNLTLPRLEVEVRDAAGQPVPSVELVVTWSGGEEHFFTGFKPELGLGYADYEMTVGIIYTLRLADGGQPVENLTPVECAADDGSRFWGGWRVLFVQP
jgi:hypothetical protein